MKFNLKQGNKFMLSQSLSIDVLGLWFADTDISLLFHKFEFFLDLDKLSTICLLLL